MPPSYSTNYRKWDALELSDDSDIEGHPNVDHASLVRMHQRKIHQERAERDARIEGLKKELGMNESLLKRMDEVREEVKKEGLAVAKKKYVEGNEKRVEGLKKEGWKEGDKLPYKQPTEEEMIVELLRQILTDKRVGAMRAEGGVSDAVASYTEGERGDKFLDVLAEHKKRLEERQVDARKEIEKEEAEKKKKITSDDLKIGWDSSHVNKGGSKQVVELPKAPSEPKDTKKTKTKTPVIEVLNPSTSTTPAVEAPASDDEEEGDLPALTPSARAFAKLPRAPADYSVFREAISRDPSLLLESTSDSLLAEAFEAGMAANGEYGKKSKKNKKEKEEYCKQCVHRALLAQYTRQLGKDGVALFFRRMVPGSPGLKVFLDDVEATSTRILNRSKELLAEREARGESGGQEVETIQLVSQDPTQKITFSCPDGPPPEDLRLEGEGTEDLDIEEVRAYLQNQWNVWQSFSDDLKVALKSGDLDSVNKVLGKMSVEEGERVVQGLDEGGILKFASNEILDRTGKDASGQTQVDLDEIKA
ncbi:hypothetical protein BT69DRAFT_1264947 [Atractiella rhizophila]|nr:hypothetical protein BT69DRAFT_1264947 [Atractiella rhizophila]